MARRTFASQKELQDYAEQTGKVCRSEGVANVSGCPRQRLPTTDSVMAIPLLACCRDARQRVGGAAAGGGGSASRLNVTLLSDKTGGRLVSAHVCGRFATAGRMQPSRLEQARHAARPKESDAPMSVPRDPAMLFYITRAYRRVYK
jgi:hypothetical protein